MRHSSRHRPHSGERKSFPQFQGRVQMTREGNVYVIVEGQEEDIFVKASRTRGALDGDTVTVAVTGGRNTKRREGVITEIVKRSGRQFVGILHFVGGEAWVLMQSRSMPYDISVSIDEAFDKGAEKGMKVAAVVDRWDRGDINPRGHIVDVLGYPGENDTEMHAILAEFNLPYRFEKEVEDAADAISDKIRAKDMKGRRDCRDVFTFTIDPTDAKDFDDALSFKALPDGNFEVGVHIADVSYYVTPGSTVDREARERGTSVYLVDRTVPMLPEKLCNKLCSLRAGEDKLTFSTIFEITPDAKVVRSWIGRTAICSDARLDYEQAQAIIDGGQSGCSDGSLATLDPTAEAVPPLMVPRVAHSSGAATLPSSDKVQLYEAILKLNDLATILRGRRFKAGAINFERPELKVVIDQLGRPVDVYQEKSTPSHWLIEEFMLLANRTVAEFVAKQDKTFVYRIHGEPNPEKLEGLRSFAGSFGYKVPEMKNEKDAAKALTKLLASSKDKPENGAFVNLALRAMAKAVYSTDNIGHYGLAFKYYTHFTSPIRRYPDLMVHRLLADYLAGGKSQSKDYFAAECEHASARELVAADAERTSIKYKLVEYMQDKVGDEFEGNVSGITEWGMYVEIQPSHIEGMVALREIRSDFFEYDEKHYRLVGKRTHKKYRLGDPVRIRVSNANLEQRLLDFQLIEK